MPNCDPLLSAAQLLLLGQDTTALAILQAAAASPAALPALQLLVLRAQMVVVMAEEAQALEGMGDSEGAQDLRALASRQLDDPELARGLPQSFAGLRVAVARYLGDLTACVTLPA